MNCPYCSAKMEEGRFLGDRVLGLVWLPKDAKPPLMGLSTISLEERGGLSLADSFSMSLREGYSLAAYICRTCKKGVFDLTERDPAILYLGKDKSSES